MKVEIPVNETTVEIILCLHAIFQDSAKVTWWLKTKNLNFGGCSPVELIRRGKGLKVKAFAESEAER